MDLSNHSYAILNIWSHFLFCPLQNCGFGFEPQWLLSSWLICWDFSVLILSNWVAYKIKKRVLLSIKTWPLRNLKFPDEKCIHWFIRYYFSKQVITIPRTPRVFFKKKQHFSSWKQILRKFSKYICRQLSST